MPEVIDEWLLWPEAVTWILSHDRAITAEIGEWFRTRMTEHRSATYVYAIRISEIALHCLELPDDEDARIKVAASAVTSSERDLMQMLERGTCTARGKRTKLSSPEMISSWDWADSVVSGSRSFELRGALNREVKFFDVRIAASGLAGWSDSEPLIAIEEAEEKGSVLPWSEQQMKLAIASCPVSNREEAWKQVFLPRLEEHQWKLRAFREIWSTARGTRGMIGRPEKRAPKDAL